MPGCRRMLIRPQALRGGRSERRFLDEFDQTQLQKGMRVEREHTNDPCIALMIASDHVCEFPDYYSRLEKMEAEAKKYWSSRRKP